VKVSARRSIQTARTRFDEARSYVPGLQTAVDVMQRDRLLGGELLSGAVAFRVFVFLVPLSLLSVSALGFLAASNADSPEDAARAVGISALTAQSVAEGADAAKGTRWLALIIGLWALYIASIAFARALRVSHALAWRDPVPPMKKTWRVALIVIGGTIPVVAVNAGLNKARSEASGLGLGLTLFAVLVFGAMWLGVSLLLPHRNTPWTALLPGAVLLGVGAQALHLVTVYYIAERIASSSELYGPLGAAIAILTWGYFFGRLTVGSAMLNAMLWERRSEANPEVLQ
jgi:uncharacterized BrkB/YihY/UPF0761 family membrane protein